MLSDLGSIRIARTSVSASPSAAAWSARRIAEESNPKGLRVVHKTTSAWKKQKEHFARNTPRRPAGPELCSISNAVGGLWFPGLPRPWA